MQAKNAKTTWEEENLHLILELSDLDSWKYIKNVSDT